MMTSRERVLTALSHQKPDRVPITLAYQTPEQILTHYGKTKADLPMRQDIVMAHAAPSEPNPGIRERYYQESELPAAAEIDIWGVARWHSSSGESHSVVGPLRHVETVDEVDAFPWPHVDADTVAAQLSPQVLKYHDQGLAVTGGGCSIFERSWYMMGMENLLMALYTNIDLVTRIFDHVTDRIIEQSRGIALSGADILCTSDDIAGQNGMLLSPDLWRQTLKPRLAATIAAARDVRPDMPVFYHSDGNCTDVIDDLIDIGVTILNPIQPEVMDPFAIKKRYGDRLTLWGTIGTQSTLPFARPEEVREIVKTYCQTLGEGGGYVIAPSHAIKEDVPWENIVAFYEGVESCDIKPEITKRKAVSAIPS